MPRVRLHLARTAGLGVSGLGYTHQAGIELELDGDDCRRLGVMLRDCLEEIASQSSTVRVLHYGLVEAQAPRIVRDFKQLVMQRVAAVFKALRKYGVGSRASY